MVKIQKISLLFVLLLATIFANAEEVEINGIHYRLIDGSTNQLEVYKPDGISYEGDLVVLPEVEVPGGLSLPVVGISESAFEGSTGLKSINIPASVKSIGKDAFRGCDNLKKAIFASIKDLCSMSFANYNANPLYLSHHLFIDGNENEVTTLRSGLELKDVKTINDFAFAGGINITNIQLPSTLKKIGNYAFTGCKDFILTYYDFNQMLDIDYGVTNSNPMSLAKKVELSNGSLPEDETHIESNVKDRAFQGAKWLKKLIIDPNVTSIGKYAFCDCVNMKSVTFSEKLERIGESAFEKCRSIEEVTIPVATETIERYAFLYCTSLKEVTIKAPITTLNEGLFKGCTSLNTVNLPKATQTIGKNTFYETSLTSLPLPEKGGEGLKTIREYAFAKCKIQSLVIPSSIVSIDKYAFSDCTNLSDITISEPETQLTILEKAFSSSKDPYLLPNLEHIYSYAQKAPSIKDNSFLSQKPIQLVYPEGASNYDQAPWNQFSTTTIGTHTITYLIDNFLEYKKDTLDAGQKIIPPVDNPVKEGWHFEGWIEDIPELMPNNDLVIHGYFTKKHPTTDGVEYMLSSDSDLKKEAKVIGYINPNQVTIPATVELGSESFKVVGIEARAFKDATTLTTVDLSQASNLTSIGNAVFSGCTALESVIWPATLSEIKDGMFFECTALSTFEIPATVTAIGDLAFSNSGITAITLPKSINTMGTSVFKSCTNLKNVEFEPGMDLPTNMLPDYTFYECTGLTKFPTLPLSITIIGKSAFEKCSIDSLELNETALKIISNQAFFSCGALKSITLPATLESLGNNAFSSCQSVEKITINRSEPPAKENNSFSPTVYDGASLYVPNVDMYRRIDTWNLFKKVYPIEPREIPAGELEITLDQESYTYTGSEIKPVPTVKWKKEKEGEENPIISDDEYTISYSDNINVGDATITITDKDGGNYKFESTPRTYKITPKAGKLEELLAIKPQPAGDSIIYTNKNQNLIKAGTIKKGITGGFKGTLKYSLDKDNIAFDTIPQRKDAKEYTVYYMVDGDPNYTSSDTDSLKVTIYPRSTSVRSITLSQNSYIYDGKAKEPTVTSVIVNYGGGIAIDTKEYKVSYVNNVNATNKDSKAQVEITDSLGGNFTLDSKTKDFEITPAKGKLDSLLTKKPIGIDSLRYTGEAQNLIQDGQINEEKFKGQFKYSLDNKVFDTAIPQGTKAQDYTIYYKVEDDPNYTASDTLSLTVAIKAKDIAISAENITLEKDSFTYDGTAKKPGVTVKIDNNTIIPAEEYLVSYLDSINVGDATVTITDKDGGNYKFESTSKTYKITPKAGKLEELLATKPQPAGDSIIYTNKNQNLIKAGTIKKGITGGFKGTLKYSLDKDNIAFDTIPQRKDAKEYTVYYMVDGDPNYTSSDTDSLKVTIYPRSTSVRSITLSQNSYIYDGKAKEPTVTSVIVNYGGGIAIDTKEYKVSYVNNVNATNKDSKAQVEITDSLGGNFTLDSKTKDFEITPAKGKLDSLLTKKPIGIDSLRYTGEAQNLIQDGQINEEKFKGQFKYSLDNKVFDTAIPQGTKAQDYTIYYKVEDDPNYTASDTLSLTVAIKAKDIAISAENITLEKDSFTYDGTAKKPGVTVKKGETTIPAEEYTVSYADSINAGTATVTVTAKKGSNYKFGSVSKTYKITPKAGMLEELLATKPQSAGNNITYNTNPQNLIKVGTIKKGITGGFKGTLKYSLDKDNMFDTAIPQGTDAKEYTVYYKVEGDPNYTSSDTDSLKVTINPRSTQVSSISLSQSSYTYDGTAKEPAVSSVTVKYNNIVIDPKEYKVSYANNINATTKDNKAYVIIKDNEGGNYSFEEAKQPFDIAPAKGKLDNLLTQKPAGIDNLSYTGKAQNLIQAGKINEEKSKDGKLKYSLDNKVFDTAIPQGTKVQEYTVYYKVEDDPNYTASDTLSLTVAIKAKEISISADNITLEKDSYIYDGTAKKPGVTVKKGETTIPAEEYTVSYADSINVGTATVTVTAKKGSNYKFASVSKPYKITPAASSLTKAPTAKTNIIYNGNDLTLINAGTSGTGKVQYSLSKDEKSFSEKIPTGKNAGDYTVYYRVKGDANHSDSEIGSVKATIAPKEINSFSLSQSSYIYSGSEIKPNVIVEFNKQAISKDEYTVSYSNNKNVGIATVTISDKAGGNFKVSGSKTFTITQAALTISGNSYEIFEGEAIPKFTVKYDGFVNNETEAALTKKPILRCSAIVGSKPGDYTINVSGAEAANYKITHKNGKLTILALKFVAGGNTSKDEDDPATYQITSTGSDEGTTPTISIIDDKDVGGAFAIPETVTYHSKTFTVTEIGTSAFENNKNLSEVTIPSSVTNIGDKAFKGCSNLKAITVYITTPISLSVAGTRGEGTRSDGASVFEGVDKISCVLYVPDGSVDLYKAAPVWCEFKHIVPLSTLTDISGVNVTEDEPFDIYNLQGIKVKSKATDLRGLPRGIYIINGKKVAVK